MHTNLNRRKTTDKLALKLLNAELQHTHEALDMCFTKVRQQGRKTGLHTCSQHTPEEKLQLLDNTATTFPETGVNFNKVGSFRSNLTLC